MIGAAAPVIPFARPIAPAVFFATQKGMGFMPDFDLYLLTADVPGHPVESSVSAQTLLALGYQLPPKPEGISSPQSAAPTLPQATAISLCDASPHSGRPATLLPFARLSAEAFEAVSAVVQQQLQSAAAQEAPGAGEDQWENPAARVAPGSGAPIHHSLAARLATNERLLAECPRAPEATPADAPHPRDPATSNSAPAQTASAPEGSK